MASSFLEACLASPRSGDDVMVVVKQMCAYREKLRDSCHNMGMQVAFLLQRRAYS
jgi:hypothetical protein